MKVCYRYLAVNERIRRGDEVLVPLTGEWRKVATPIEFPHDQVSLLCLGYYRRKKRGAK